ncbi:hypothetical protein CMV_025299, partial [Castanea mollissima]
SRSLVLDVVKSLANNTSSREDFSLYENLVHEARLLLQRFQHFCHIYVGIWQQRCPSTS